MSIVRGEIIAAKRIEMKMDQAELAHLIETSQSRLSTYESGSRQPTLRVLIKIANALNCSIDDLVDRDKTLELSDLAPDELALLQEYRNRRRTLQLTLVKQRLAKAKGPLLNAVERIVALLESQTKV